MATDAEAAPQPPESVYDWDLSMAAHAAASVLEQQQMQAWAAAAAAPIRRVSAPSNLEAAAAAGVTVGSPLGLQSPLASADDSSGARKEALPAAGSSGSAAAGTGKPDLKGFMNKIGADFHKAGGGMARGIQKALDETSKGLQKVAQVCMHASAVDAWQLCIKQSCATSSHQPVMMS